MPDLTETQLDRVIEIVSKRGGALAFMVIDEKADKTLLRLNLVRVSGRLDERAKKKSRNNQSLAAFKNQVVPQLRRPQNANVTDFYAPLARLDLFFKEAVVPKNAQKAVLVLSDGIHTAPQKKAPSARIPEATVFAVGMEEELARRIFKNRALLFESTDAAIEALTTFEKGGKDDA